MSERKPVVVDTDPTDMQLEALGDLGLRELRIADLTSPEAVQLLLYIQRITLAHLKAAEGEAVSGRGDNTGLRSEREGLRVELATLRASSTANCLEIPASILAGFAINMLTSGSNQTLGWVFLLLATLMLLFIRRVDLTSALKSCLLYSRKELVNG